MTQRGPKPKPFELKVLEGNRTNRPLKEPPPYATANARVPKPPITLPKNALIEWRKVYPALQRIGVLKTTDLANLALYCAAVGRYEDASEVMEMISQGKLERAMLMKTKNGLMESPLVGTQRRAALDAARLGAEFGLTPSSRARLGIQDAPKATKLSKFMGG